MKRIAQATEDFFKTTLTFKEQRLLNPDADMFTMPQDRQASWPMWTQEAMMTILKCIGERSGAPLWLKRRGGLLVVAALSRFVPEIRREFGGGLALDDV